MEDVNPQHHRLGTGHVQPPPEYGATAYEGEKVLENQFHAACLAAENRDVLKADLRAVESELIQLERAGNRENLKRLEKLESRRSALKKLSPSAVDTADKEVFALHARLWGAWYELRNRAAEIPKLLIEQRAKQVRECKALQSADLPHGRREQLVDEIASSWQPLRKLVIDADGRNWTLPYAYYVAVRDWIVRVEADPSIIEREDPPPFPS